MGYGSITTEELIKKIAERKRFLKKVVNFVEDIVLNHGEVIRRAVESSNINVVKRFSGFDHFLFVADWGQTMFGGNEVKVWYYPHRADINPDKILPVLHVYYQPSSPSIDDLVVKHFDEDNRWQTDIGQAMRHKSILLRQFLKDQENLKKRKKLESKTQSERSKIEKEAERLGI